MKTFEKYIEEISTILANSHCDNAHLCNICNVRNVCEKLGSLDEKEIQEFLLSDYKEPIRLTQLEYDLLEVYYNNAYKSNYNQLLRSYNVICKLKEKGYFKNLDLDMTIGEFKENVKSR